MFLFQPKNYAILLACLCFAAIVVSYLPDEGRPTLATSVNRSDACFMAQKLVLQQLRAPSTAELPEWTEENCIARQSGDKWIVHSYIDAENGFGAMIRSNYSVEMRYDISTATWTLLDIAILNP